ncbi:MAG: 5'/3'-nucleotidase SurE, partial [Candidatus Omnitrophica bacterium]|nr:5'/3'-nucleotidase SurE [Candidatus Omnitrophota bacterium]
INNGLPEGVVLNVNVPQGKPLGVKVVPLSKARYREYYEKRVNPRKKVYYWLTGEFIEETDIGQSDIKALREGFITITPLTIDMTSYESLKVISGWFFDNFNAGV